MSRSSFASRRRAVAMRLAASVATTGFVAASGLAAGVAVAATGLAGCAHAPTHARAETDAIVVVRSNVPDAQLYVDGKFVASLDALRGGIAIEPGAHRLELRREDYFSSYLELTVARAERKQIAIDLAAILP